MSMTELNRVALPVFTLVNAVVVVALPTWRVWRATGVWPILDHRPSHPLQPWVAGWLGVQVTAFVIWVALYSWRGPSALGVWMWPDWLGVVAWTVTICGSALIVLGQFHLGRSWRVGIDDRPTHLVTHGVYRFSRNPIFTGIIIMFGGIALLTPCAWTAMGWLFLVALLGVQARAEEQHLLRLHGQEYGAYASRVGRFVRGFGRLKGKEGEPHRYL